MIAPHRIRTVAAMGMVTAIALAGVIAALPGEARAGRIVFEEAVIEGEVQKPQVAVYITRQNLNDRYQLELKESFVPKILESVENPPF